jgi:hypothetical protein
MGPSAAALSVPPDHLPGTQPLEVAKMLALRLPCRAIAVDGPVRAEAPPSVDGGAHSPDGEGGGAPGLQNIALQEEIPNDAWITLGNDGRLVAKDPRTTRETAFDGPGRVKACVGHAEESWLASGKFESSVGAGETPGAEEWVVTPLGVVRYMAGRLTVEVRMSERSQGSEVRVTVGSGGAFLAPADDAAVKMADAGPATLDDDGWLRMSEGVLTLAPRGAQGHAAAAPTPLAAAEKATAQCTTMTQRARTMADDLASGDGLPDAAAAKEQVKTRRLARAACALAKLRADALPPSKSRDGLWSKLHP